MTNAYKEKYIKLLQNFHTSLPELDYSGITAPHIPTVGELYEKSKYKIAFFGMETRGWCDLEELRTALATDPLKAFEYLTEDFRELEFINWTNNFGTSFWNFIFSFLAKLYNINDWKRFKTDESIQYILRTFIWGNTNSIERYIVTAEKNGVNFQTWEIVKNSSRIFDTASHILETCTPDILLVMNWNESEQWLAGTQEFEKDELGDHLFHVFLNKTHTHVYWLAHPRWIACNGGFEAAINLIMADISQRKTHLQSSYSPQLDDIFEQIIDKKEYIGQLAKFLSKNKKFMSGFELANHLNRNGFRTSYGTLYSGTRGTYKLIRDCYQHFQNANKTDTAAAIANAFVKENGEYAYE